MSRSAATWDDATYLWDDSVAEWDDMGEAGDDGGESDGRAVGPMPWRSSSLITGRECIHAMGRTIHVR